MTGPLSDLGDWRPLGDVITDCQVAALRRQARALGDGLDRDARRAVEGAGDWRNPHKQEDRHASARS